jgi:hypothetical protein
MSSTPQIPTADIAGLNGYALERMSRKFLDDARYALGRKAQKGNQLGPNMKSFAHMAVAQGSAGYAASA